jgi:hypothetical protein
MSLNEPHLMVLSHEVYRRMKEGLRQCAALMDERPGILDQVENVIRSCLERRDSEVLELETSLEILVGPAVTRMLILALHMIRSHDEIQDLRRAGVDERVVQGIQYLVARYSVAFHSSKSKIYHPLGWKMFSHSVTSSPTGARQLLVRILRNDQQVLVIEDSMDAMLRLINHLLQAIDQLDDYEAIDENLLQEFTARYYNLYEKVAERGVNTGSRTEH